MLRLMFERRKKKLTQNQLAEIIGVSRITMNKWETGKSAPSVEMLLKLSEYFEVTTDYLLRKEEPNGEL